MDFDWRQHHVIYHGWNRPGWVNHARPYVHVPNVYVNRSRPFINETWRHDMSHGDPERFRASQPGRVSRGTVAHTPEVRGRGTTQMTCPGSSFRPEGRHELVQQSRQAEPRYNQPAAGATGCRSQPTAVHAGPSYQQRFPAAPSCSGNNAAREDAISYLWRLQGRQRGKVAEPSRPGESSEQHRNTTLCPSCKQRERARGQEFLRGQTGPVTNAGLR